MREIEGREESQVEQAAYEEWVAEARAHGLNGVRPESVDRESRGSGRRMMGHDLSFWGRRNG